MSQIIYTPQNKVLTYQLQPMPCDVARQSNNISAGWLLSEMDKASGRRAHEYIYAGDQANDGRTVTAGIDSMSFKKPLYIGDLVRIYTEVVRQGRSSLTIRTDCWAERSKGNAMEKVTEGLFTFVAIGADHRPVEILTNKDFNNPILADPARSPKKIVTQMNAPVGMPTMTVKPNRKNTNPLGDVFGGWILSKMDEASAKVAAKETGHTVANVAINAMSFYKPVSVGDEVTFRTRIDRTGTSSITIGIETWARRAADPARHEKVTEGLFTYVAVDKNFRPIAF